jgi:hypothetical protein
MQSFLCRGAWNADALELLAEALTAQVPFGWVTMDDGYGQYPQVRNWLAAHRMPYVVATSAVLPLTQTSVPPGAVPITRAVQLLSRLAEGELDAAVEHQFGSAYVQQRCCPGTY